jgi:DNA (cytosine-5)-methyltransferase 1
LAHASSQQQQRQREYGERCGSAKNPEGQADFIKPEREQSFWSIEPRLDRVADGVAHRVDRLKAIGNGQVPLQAAVAFKMLESLYGGE